MSMGTAPVARGKGKRVRSNAEINVTPLVDVMLVLLVIFMITAPTLKEGFQVTLPEATETNSVHVQDARLIIITEEGFVLKNQAATPEDRYEKLGELVTDLKGFKAECEREKRAPVVVINGDRRASYERFIQVWNAVRQSGISQVGFQVEPSGPAVVAK